MRFVLMNAKKCISRTGNEYYKALVFDYDYDVLACIFINENDFSFINENNLINACIDKYIIFKYDVERQAYRLSFDINK